jgi:hypothetical protein
MSCYECACRLEETARLAGVETCPLYSLMCSVFDPTEQAEALIIANSIAQVSLVVRCAHEVPRVPGSNEAADKCLDASLLEESRGG